MQVNVGAIFERCVPQYTVCASLCSYVYLPGSSSGSCTDKSRVIMKVGDFLTAPGEHVNP